MNTPWWFNVKKFARNVFIIPALALTLFACGKKKPYVVQSGDSYRKIATAIAEELWYDSLTNAQKNTLVLQLQDWNPELKAESLKTGDTVNYDEKGIKVLLGGGEEVKKDDEIKKEEKTSSKESVSTWPIKINSMKKFKDSKDPRIKELYSDPITRTPIEKAINDGYTVLFLSEREATNAPLLKLEDIIKPKEILDNSLKGKVFTLDPGHGSMDTWAIGLAQYGEEQNKEKIIVYEAPIAMDYSYRVAQLILAHGGKVYLTHYITTRWILNEKDIPPASRFYDPSSDTMSYQDSWTWSRNKDWLPPRWTFFAAAWSGEKGKKSKRERLENISSHGGQSDAFISIHLDKIMKNATEADENKKVCDIYYNTTDKSKEFANDLFNNGFGYYYNGKKAESVSHGAIPSEGNHYYYVVRESNVKGACVLVEIANISNPDQAYLMRNPETRQTLAKQFVDALIKTVQ